MSVGEDKRKRKLAGVSLHTMPLSFLGVNKNFTLYQKKKKRKERKKKKIWKICNNSIVFNFAFMLGERLFLYTHKMTYPLYSLRLSPSSLWNTLC